MFLFESKTGLLSTCELSNGYKSENKRKGRERLLNFGQPKVM